MPTIHASHRQKERERQTDRQGQTDRQTQMAHRQIHQHANEQKKQQQKTIQIASEHCKSVKKKKIDRYKAFLTQIKMTHQRFRQTEQIRRTEEG